MKRITDDTKIKKLVRLMRTDAVEADRLLENYFLERVDSLIIAVPHASGEVKELAHGDVSTVRHDAVERAGSNA